MNIEPFENSAQILLQQSTPNLADLSTLVLEMEELISSDEFSSLSSEEQNRLQGLRKELRNRLRESETGEITTTSSLIASDPPPRRTNKTRAYQRRFSGPGARPARRNSDG